jgi:hypothetical protein
MRTLIPDDFAAIQTALSKKGTKNFDRQLELLATAQPGIFAYIQEVVADEVENEADTVVLLALLLTLSGAIQQAEGRPLKAVPLDELRLREESLGRLVDSAQDFADFDWVQLWLRDIPQPAVPLFIMQSLVPSDPQDDILSDPQMVPPMFLWLMTVAECLLRAGPATQT